MKQRVKDKIEKRSTELLVLSAIIVVGGAVATASSSNILDAGASSSDGLVAEYRFDTEAGNTAYDTSGGNNDGTISGASWTSGVKGGALSFDGQDDVINTGVNIDQSSGGESYTFCAWSKLSSTGGGTQQIISSDDGGYDWSILKNKNNQEFELFHGSGVLSSDVSTDTRWHHVCGVFDNSNDQAELYVDGRLTGTSDLSYDTNDNDIDIGANPSSGFGEHWNGKIDNALIYSKALNHSQINSLYNSGSWRIGTVTDEDDPSKVAEFSFQHQNSSHVLDTSGYNNHGERMNGVGQTGAVNCKVGRCYSFDGNDDKVETSIHPKDIGIEDNKEKTIMAWTKVNSFNGAGIWEIGLTQDSKEFSMRTRSSQDAFRAQLWSSGDIDFSCDASGKWSHIALTHDGSVTEIYCNGLKVAQQSQTVNTTKGEPFTVGEWSGSVLDGKVDQVKVFNRSLSQAEIIEKTQGLESNGAVLDMRFDSGGGDHVEDYSRKSNHGSLSPNSTFGPDRVNGLMGEALKFDGTDDEVSISGDSSLHMSDGAWTQVLWAKGEHDGNNMNALRLGSGWQTLLAIPNQDTWQGGFYNGNGWNYVSADVDTSKLHQIVFVGRENEIELWIDGEEVDSLSTSDSPPSSRNSGNAVLGSVGGGRYYNGVIERARVFQQPLSSSEIKQLYASGKSHVGSSSGNSNSGLQDGLVLSQSFNRIETCGQSDTVSCPSGMSGEVAVDESGNANHGELVNGPTVKGAGDCKVDGCLGFSGSGGERVQVNSDKSHTFGDEDFTATAWIKSTASGWNSIMTQGEAGFGESTAKRYVFSMRDSNAFMEVDDDSTLSTVSGSTVVNDGEWHHLSAIRDTSADELRLYVDGKLDSVSSDNTGSISEADGSLFTGIAAWNDNQFKGSIDQTRIYNRSLSDQEVWKLYTNGRDREKGMGSPIGWWRMDSYDGYDYMKSVTVEENSGSQLSNYPVRFNLDTASLINSGKMQSDCSDMRVMNSNKELDIWYEDCNTDNTSVYAEMESLPASGEKELSILYGNDNAKSVKNGSKTFNQFDNCEDGDMDEWVTNGASVEATSSTVRYGDYSCRTYSGSGGEDAQYGETFYLEEGKLTFWSRVSSTDTLRQEYNCDSFGENCYNSFTYEANGEFGTHHSARGVNYNTNEWYRWVVEFSFTDNKHNVRVFDTDDNEVFSWSGSQSNNYDQSSKGSRWGNHRIDDEIFQDNFRLRKWADPSPSVTLGREQEIDSSGEKNKGYVHSNPKRVQGKTGEALDFDGSDDYVEISSISKDFDDITISAWVNLDSTSGDQPFVALTSDLSELDNNNANENFNFAIWNGEWHTNTKSGGSWASGLDPSNPTPTSGWHHFSVVYDTSDSTRTMYLDGKQIAQDSNYNNPGKINGIRIGGKSYNGDTDGKIDDVRIYPYALNKEQVKQVMNVGAVSVG